MSNKESIAEISKVLEPLAQKLGEGAGHVYEVYVRQMFAEGVSLAIIGTFFLILIVTAIVLVSRTALNNRGEEDDEAAITVVACMLIPLCVLVFALTENTMKIINPEYYAIERIVNQVRSR